MAKRIVSQLFLNCKTKGIAGATNKIHSNKLHTDTVPVREIQIPVQWGHIAAKLWGSGQDRPLLALHGWQDNAGTWDPLAPLLIEQLNNKRSILCIDLPGHGLSSWQPPGVSYYAWDYPRLILYLKNYFKWDKVSLLSHSMGSIAAFRFACIFPEDVDFYIGFDSFIYDDYDLHLVIDKYPMLLKKALMSQTWGEKEPPSYTREEIIKRWHLGTTKSVAIESVPYLLERGSKVSKHDPNKLYISRDPRLKYTLFNPEDKKFVEAYALRLKCPTLYLKGIDSPYNTDEFSVTMRDLVEKNNEKFHCQYVPGTHHVHLNNPEVVLPPIVEFLKNYNLMESEQIHSIPKPKL